MTTLRTLFLASALLFAACASGPRPLPATATPAERLTQADAVLAGLQGATATFTAESQGQHPSTFKGQLVLAGGNALALTAEGTFEGRPVRVDMDSRSGDTLRTVTRGPSASAQKEPVGGGLGEAVRVRMLHLGVLHDLATLTQDQPLENAQGGVRKTVRALEPSDTGSATVGGEPCHRVSFGLEIDGKAMGSATVCLADRTSLPLERTTLVHFEAGDMQATERYEWVVK